MGKKQIEQERTNNNKYKSMCLTLSLISGIGGFSSVQGANWLMLQGTEPAKAPSHRFWGFIQPQYTDNEAPELKNLKGAAAANNGKTVAANLVGPQLESSDKLQLRRARVGARGKVTDKIHYFSLIEAAPNALTYEPFGGRHSDIALSDLSLTLNHIPGARIRAGLFKNPIAEEPLQAIHVFNYIEFTDFTNRELHERFTKGAVQPAGSPSAPALGIPEDEGYGFSAFRDWGVQVFDHYKMDKWDLSYAVKVGRGEAINKSNTINSTPELYLYTSAEYDLPGGKGPKKNGIKMFAWRQQGEREFDNDSTGKDYDRIRQGVGVKALGKLFGSSYKHRITAEFMQADGMIFIAPQGNVVGGNLQYAAEKGNKARGWYVDYGFYLNKNWEFDIRYDQNDLLYETNNNINDGNERKIKGTTFGINYHFTPKMRLTFNYIQRSAEAPEDYSATVGFPSQKAAGTTYNVNQIVDNLDDRVAVQFTWIF